MGKRIRQLGITGCIVLFLQSNVLAQTQGNDLHKTVTHINDPFAKVEEAKNKKSKAAVTTLNRLSHENTMPQNENEFGTWTSLVSIFKQFVTERLPELNHNGMAHGIHLPHGYNYKKWTKEDLTNLATAYNGVEMFETLAMLKNAAGAKAPTEKLSAQDIEDAQSALEHLKPDCCADWKAFGKIIHSVAKETEAKRAALMERKKQRPRGTGALVDLGKFNNIAGDPMDALDQQKALEQLDKNAVKMDSEHSLKSPDPRAVALDVVKSIKGVVRAA